MDDVSILHNGDSDEDDQQLFDAEMNTSTINAIGDWRSKYRRVLR